MLIIVVTSNRGQIYELFAKIQRKTGFLDSTVECELCVYGQEKGETERITRVLLRTQLGASLN